ncbi:class I SAM-dependent methyltransferase, partial [Candidatus Peregrinibacteria bacterium]|nr:class I SAM-dependent methyltransferase [Candidatus Peregrinibacteria bacterium]
IDFTEIKSLKEFLKYKLQRHDEYNRRYKLECESIGNTEGFLLKGYCAVCHNESSFYTDFQHAVTDYKGDKHPNWREHLVCGKCKLNNRMRASIHLFQQKCAPHKNADIYITEQTTPLYAWLKQHYTSVIGSEYLGSTCGFGENNSKNIRNESLTELSFANNSFDYILSFDVFEHIPNYQTAIQECARVLRAGGQMLFSVPFMADLEKNNVRARICQDGTIEHLMPPEYHGDPINSDGCLCFYHFGWQLLDEFRKAGFNSVKALFFWSDKLGYLGVDQKLFIATKSNTND